MLRERIKINSIKKKKKGEPKKKKKKERKKSDIRETIVVGRIEIMVEREYTHKKG
jgi:hypothetical protein